MNKKPILLRTLLAIVVMVIFGAAMYPLTPKDFYSTFTGLLKDKGDKTAAALIEDARARQAKDTVDEKMLLSVVKHSNSGSVSSPRLALNDVVISHSEFLGISEFTVCGPEGGVRYRADGVVIATPAGSTAYSLSAGGPVVSHNLDALVVTPVCPHSFFDRSILFASDECVTVENTGKEKLNISVDGRCFSPLLPMEKCVVYRSENRVKFLTFSKNNMFSTLFGKMRIMGDI